MTRKGRRKITLTDRLMNLVTEAMKDGRFEMARKLLEITKEEYAETPFQLILPVEDNKSE